MKAELKHSTINLHKCPAIRGYILEDGFLNYSESCFNVNTCDGITIKSLSLAVGSRIQCDSVITNMSKGVLYKLRMGHPFIDGVGVLKDQNNNYWLVYTICIAM